MTETPFDLETACGVVDKIFSTRVSRGGLLTRVDAGQELLPGTLFSFTMLNELPERLGLQLFKGLGSIGEALWQHEMRSLRSLSTLHEPGLPRIVEGDFYEPDDVAYVITESSELTLASPGVMEFLAEAGHEPIALGQLHVLLTALKRMHGRGLIHRNVVPDAIEALVEQDDQASIRLRFGRFEMSTLVANLARSQRTDQPDLIEAFQSRGWITATYTAPERLWLVDPRFGPLVDDWRGDVYGLGMLAYSWFVSKGAFGTEEQIDSTMTKAQVSEIIERRRTRTELARELPRDLRDLIRGMLAPDWRTRLTAHEACEVLNSRGHAIGSSFAKKDRDVRRSPLLVSLAADHFDDTLVKWATLSKPVDEATRLVLKLFIENDLSDPALTYVLDGFAAFSEDSSNPKRQQAKFVLVGSEYLYFCTLYQQNPFGGAAYPEVLHIRYVLSRQLSAVARTLARSVLVPLPRLELIFNNAASAMRQGRSSWQPLLDRASRQPAVPERRVQFEEAIDWLLDVNEALLAARQYPYVSREDLGLGYYALMLNAPLNKKRRFSMSVLNAWDRVRPALPFGAFFKSLDSDVLHVWPGGDDDDFRPRRDPAARATVRFQDAQGEDRLVVRLEDGSLPDRGWIMPADDQGTFEVFLRQRRARDELFEMDALVDQLQRPSVLFTDRMQWKGVGDGLEGSAPQVLERMLNAWPFFAVHGPPGTGKTTVAARAVAAILADDKSHRILVSAQSHDSLDNIGERILGTLKAARLDGQVNALRIASSATEMRVSEAMLPLLPRQMAETRREMIQRHVDSRLAQTSDPALRSILTRWRTQCETGVLEIADRLRRGANVVFATCGSATQRNLSVVGADDMFDWVIVEEAAKAWPTELAIALVRGTRWTLIGDHLQLKAFGRPEVEAILEACKSSHDRLLRDRTEKSDAFVDVFDLFANIFRGWHPEDTPQPNRPRRPCGVLDTQFRMAKPIGDLVSDVFYHKLLKTGALAERPHGLTAPPLLQDRRLVWIDTQGSGCEELAPKWRNPKEAIVVRDLLQLMALPPNGPLSLAVLTPYWQQVHELRRILGPADIAIQTSDSFQGKEADVVVLSLVRTNGKDDIQQRIGFLSDPPRVNVMLSRARRLLIVVGDFQHFATSNPSIWTEVTSSFRKLGYVCRAERVVGTAPTGDGRND